MVKKYIQIKDRRDGKIKIISLKEYFGQLGKKSVAARHKGKTKKQISEHYSKVVRLGKKNPVATVRGGKVDRQINK